jgi:hypothetical protein
MGLWSEDLGASRTEFMAAWGVTPFVLDARLPTLGDGQYLAGFRARRGSRTDFY